MKSRILAGLAFAAAISSSSGAFAQCALTSQTNVNNVGDFLKGYAASASSASGAIAGTLGNLSTAFQTQQGSAFVSAPSDPKPDQPGGGVWARGVGGEVTNKFTTNSNTTLGGTTIASFNGNGNPVSATANCSGSLHESFAGMQVGTDISRLNWAGWNVHVGLTSGYLASHAFGNNGGAIDFEVPFFGGYVVATYGRFFADVMVREEFYNGSMRDFNFGTFDQRISGHGISVSSSAGYNIPLANNWFIEPSGGFIWSRANFDTFNVSNPFTPLVGGVSFLAGAFNNQFIASPITSEIGRLSLRAGTTITSGNITWQPFASASVYSEFAGNVNSSLVSPAQGPNAILTYSSTNSTSRVGTYGQYSVGVAGQVAHTGWLGFARLDYRNGANIEGWTGNAGVRYQFSPEEIIGVMPTKAPVKAPGVAVTATNWTGFYVGGLLGVDFGKTDMRFVNDPTNTNQGSNPRVAGFLGGIQLGYNYQFPSNWVLGVEGDFANTNLKGAGPCGTAGRNANGQPTGFFGPIGFSPALMTCENAANWIATAAARVGYSWERKLFYVKAGGAWEDDRVFATCNLGPQNGSFGGSLFSTCINQANLPTNGFNTSGLRTGWLLGTGFEFDLGHNWSAKAEYDYIDFGTRTALSTDGTTIFRDSGAINQVKIGVNYHFAPQALVARY